MGFPKLEGKEKPEELIQVQLLIDDAKVEEALQLFRDFEEKGEHTLHDIVLYHLLKCELLRQQGLLENVIKLAEKTYNESLGLGKNLLSVDALLLMVGALLRLNRSDLALDKIKQGEGLLKTLIQEVPADYKQREADIAYNKGLYYGYKSDFDKALERYEQSLALREEIGSKPKIGQSLLQIARIFFASKGELDLALKYAERSLTLFEESNKKWWIAWSLFVMAELSFYKGEIEHCLIFNERCLVIYKDLNNKYGMAAVIYIMGETYRMKGDFDRALECFEHCLVLYHESGNLKDQARIHDFLIQTLIDKGDIDRARQYFNNLEKLNNQLKERDINLMYLFNKALLLKTSRRVRSLAKAEEILIQILDDENLKIGLASMKPISILALLHLCEALIIELHMNGVSEILEEIELYVNRLLDIAENSNSYWILCETHLLQARLSLLTFDIKKAKRFLTQAQQIAERFGLNQLVKRISDERQDLLKKLSLWDKLKEAEAPMADRIELARLDEKVIHIIFKHTELTAQVTEEKVAIHKEKQICLVCRGEVFGFSYICKCGATYCENCARALSDLENVCWVCDTPLDYSKPVKLYKEERITVQEKAKEK